MDSRQRLSCIVGVGLLIVIFGPMLYAFIVLR
jgi:hypothetical protein